MALKVPSIWQLCVPRQPTKDKKEDSRLAIFFFDETCKVCLHSWSLNEIYFGLGDLPVAAFNPFMSDCLSVPMPIALTGGGSNIKVLGATSVSKYLNTTTATVTIPSGTIYAWMMVECVSSSSLVSGDGIILINGACHYIGFSTTTVETYIKSDGTLYAYSSGYKSITAAIQLIFYGE